MDLMFPAVTGLSLAMAAAMGIMLAKMVRDERRRSDARVALLSELSAERAPRVRAAPAADLELRPRQAAARPVETAAELFHVEAEPSPWPRRFAVIGVLAVVLGGGVTALKLTTSRTSDAKPAAAAAAAPQPLELLSLRHAQEADGFTITGLVQNPRNGATLAAVDATVLVFDRDGEMMTSGRAPLDFRALAPGDESPFVIRVPVQGNVARYRVGFRASDGRVIGHVDRRQSDSVARRQEP